MESDSNGSVRAGLQGWVGRVFRTDRDQGHQGHKVERMAGKWLSTLARRCQPEGSAKEVASGLRCFMHAVLGVLHPQLCSTRLCDLGSITL